MRFTEIIAEGLPKTDVKKQISKFEELALAANRAGDDAKCKQYQQKIQSLKQKLSESDLDRFKKYTRPVVKTTPKIERTTNPAGRTTDHVEWKVTTPTGEVHRYKSKTAAQAHFDSFGEQSVEEGETWSKHNNPKAGGMSKKSVSSYRRSHPGSKIQTAVTTKPSKLKKGSKAAKRRASFCARMRGMKKHRTSAKTAHDPNSNINKSLRRWHCESIEELQELVMIAEQFIRNKKNEL